MSIIRLSSALIAQLFTCTKNKKNYQSITVVCIVLSCRYKTSVLKWFELVAKLDKVDLCKCVDFEETYFLIFKMI